MSWNFYIKEEDNNREESINRYKGLFKSFDVKTPSLSDALNQMFSNSKLKKDKIEKLTEDIINKCKTKIDPDFNTLKKKYENITKEDAYIICSYTCESEDRNYSPYRLLNRSLVSDNREYGVNNISKYLYIFLKALRKLPRFKPKNNVLYRCLTCHVSLTEDENNKGSVPYKIGNTKTFWGFTSTSIDPKMTYSFLGAKEQMKTGTIFSLSGDVWGYDIESFNFFKEKEILLEPERKFKIINALPPVNGIINIACEILKTNLVLNDNILDSTMVSYNNEDGENNSNGNLNECVIKFEIEAKINQIEQYASGIGILCTIPTKNIKALITYNRLLNLDFLNNGEKMTLYINKKQYDINIKINRFKYTNEDLNITIIEILESDDIKNFLEMDRFISSKDYSNVDILSISLKNDQELDILDGKITKKYNTPNYRSNIERHKEGIILLKNNLKLIGIIQENEVEINIIQMNNIINKINFIKCLYEIKKEDIGKDIQILNNKGKFNYEIKNEEIEREIKVIINGEIKSNIFTYKFTKEGDYIFYLICYNDLTDMSWIFNECSSLKEINLSSFNTNKVTNMSYMFNKCSSLKKLNLSSFNTNQVTNMKSMFCNCRSLIDINLSIFNTSQVTDMSFMFFNCSSLKELNLSSFNTAQVKYMSYMFSHCSSLNQLNIGSFNTNQVIDMSSMFSHCSSLKELNLLAFNTAQVTDMSCIFHNCSSLKELNLSSFNTKKDIKMLYMFDSMNKACKVSCEDNQIVEQYKNTPGCIII